MLTIAKYSFMCMWSGLLQEYIAASLRSDGGQLESLEIVLVGDAACTAPDDKKKQASPGKPYLYLA